MGANKTSPIRNRHSLRGCQGGLREAISFKPSIKRPHRITAIMPACRAGDRGSTPLEVAKRLFYSVLRFVFETGCKRSSENRNAACFIIGVSYNGSIRGLGPRGEGSTPSTPTKCPCNRIGIGTALRTQVLRVQIPPRTPILQGGSVSKRAP